MISVLCLGVFFVQVALSRIKNITKNVIYNPY